jgi:hypothetical protein
MNKTQKQKNQKQTYKHPNPLESIKDIGSSTVDSFKNDLLGQIPQDFMDQLFGPNTPQKFSGEIAAGEAVEMSEILTGQREENQKLRQQVVLERRIREEEQVRIDKKTNELKIQLKLIMDELVVLSQSTQDLAEETQIAAMQVPAEPGVYHLLFFEKLLEFLKSFKKKIHEASVWMHAVNSRAAKKNMWGANYKKSGGKYLLSGEHYLQRSAG